MTAGWRGVMASSRRAASRLASWRNGCTAPRCATPLHGGSCPIWTSTVDRLPWCPDPRNPFPTNISCSDTAQSDADTPAKAEHLPVEARRMKPLHTHGDAISRSPHNVPEPRCDEDPPHTQGLSSQRSFQRVLHTGIATKSQLHCSTLNVARFSNTATASIRMSPGLWDGAT
jgi:hypothetical protein